MCIYTANLKLYCISSFVCIVYIIFVLYNFHLQVSFEYCIIHWVYFNIQTVYTTGLKNYWYSQKCTVFDWHTLYKHCTTLYRILICTVHHCTTLYVSTDLNCTELNNTVRFYWLALYSTGQHCTFRLTRTVQYWTALYVLTDQYCTALNDTVQDTDSHCTLLYNTERGYWHALYTAVQLFFKINSWTKCIGFV